MGITFLVSYYANVCCSKCWAMMPLEILPSATTSYGGLYIEALVQLCSSKILI